SFASAPAKAPAKMRGPAPPTCTRRNLKDAVIMDQPPLCTEPGCRLPALFQAEQCRQHLPDPTRYQQKILSSLHDADGANLARVDLRQVEIMQARLAGATLTATILDGTVVEQTVLARANLHGISARGATFLEIDGTGMDASGAVLTATRWLHANLEDGRFVRAIWESAELDGVELARADLSYASLRQTAFSRCTLTESWFTEADLAEATLNGCDLSWAVLAGINGEGLSLQRAALFTTSFVGAFLDGADLTETWAEQARFSGAVLTGARLSGANLQRAIFREADLRGADLRQADLRGAIFERANLEGADLTGANLDGANM
ncbi:MAG TPA: pentapeptide repeat-containing protein, partial [Armatimonadota bacterium]